MWVQARNDFKPAVDTALYFMQERPVPGAGEFRRLTVDLGLGSEIPLGGNFFVYGDLRALLPASGYPSELLHKTGSIPLAASIHAGLRILLGD